jgi:DHA2 family multidrug resistance protein
VITVLAPVSAQLIQRKLVQPRILVLFSIIMVAIAMWHYSTFTLDTDYRHYVLARSLQGFGYSFFFVPVSIVAYSQLRPDQNNRASSITNFFRNWGGSFGIALTTTVAERRDQLHQSNVGAPITATSQQFAAQTHALAEYLATKGFTGADAALAAQVRVLKQLERQVHLLSFMDCFRVLGYVTVAVLPLVLAIRHIQSAGNAPVVE